MHFSYLQQSTCYGKFFYVFHLEGLAYTTFSRKMNICALKDVHKLIIQSQSKAINLAIEALPKTCLINLSMVLQKSCKHLPTIHM